MNLVKVTPVVSQTSSNTGALILLLAMGGNSAVEWSAEPDLPLELEGDVENASTEVPRSTKKVTDNFMLIVAVSVVVGSFVQDGWLVGKILNS